MRHLKAEHGLWLAAMVTLVTYIYVFSIAPLSGEDFALTRDFTNIDWPSRLSWIFLRSYQQVTSWNARLGEQLAIFWLSMPKAWFTLFSTAIFFGFAYLTASLFGSADGTRRRMLFAFAFVFAIWPGMEVFFWGTGSAEYLQPLILCLFCLRAYSSNRRLEQLEASPLQTIAVTLGASLAGLSFENVPVAIIGYMAFSLVIRGRKMISYRSLLPIFGMGLGWLALVTAPSTSHRRVFYREMYKVKGYSIEYFIERAGDVTQSFLTTSWPLAALSALAALITLLYSDDRKRYTGLILVAILIVMSLIAAPYTEPRAFILPWAIMFATVISGLELLTRKHRVLGLILGVVAIAGVYFSLKAASYYTNFARLSNERHYYIEAQVHTPACKHGIEVTAVDDYYPYRYINNRNNWYRANPAYVSQFYGCKVIIR